MVRATVCGRGRRGDRFTGDWASVACPDCELRRLGSPHPCLHCHLPVTGSCIHIHRFNAWLHADCGRAFEQSPLGRHLKASFPDLFGPAKCPRCGRPGENHGPTCKAFR